LDWIVMKAIEKDRARRYETANGFAMDVQRYLADEPVAVGPPSASYRLRKFVRRNRGRVFAAGLLFGTLLVGVVGTTSGLIQSRRSEAKAKTEQENAERSRDLAEHNFRMARNAVEDYSTKVAADQRLRAAGFHGLRKVGHRSKLKADFPNDSGYRFGLAQGHHNLGMVLTSTSNNEKALEAFRQASDLLEKLVAEFPSGADYLHWLANSNSARGIVLVRLGKTSEAEAVFGEAAKVQARLVAVSRVPEYLQELASARNNLGNVLADSGKPEKAEAAYRDALAVREELATTFPDVRVYRQQLGTCLSNLGYALSRQGKWTDAEAQLKRALGLQEKLVADSPDVPEYPIDLAGTYLNFADLVRDRGQPQAALEWYAKAISRLEAILAKDDRVALARDYLRNTLWGRARALPQLKRYGEALADCDRALKFDNGEKRAFLRYQRIEVLVN
jgi:tetratricopeptide (TPR) repeat protein